MAEMGAFYLFGAHEPLLALCLHMAVLILMSLWTYASALTDGADGFSYCLLPLTVVAGPFGVALCLIAAFIKTRVARGALSPSEWIESLFEANKDFETELLYERIVHGYDDSKYIETIEPLSDIISYGTIQQKQLAIAKIARYFRPRFAPLLLLAAKDGNAAVRVQAATALAKIERAFMARFMKLEAVLDVLPDNDPKKLNLAEIYDDYAHAGFLDDNSRHLLRLKAISIYKNYLGAQESEECRVRLARLQLRQKMPQEALHTLEPLIGSQAVSHRVHYWYMETLYDLRDFENLRNYNQLHDLSTNDLREPNLYLAEIADLTKVWGTYTLSEGLC